ncbi:hypothetical protein GCM10007291_36560 [Gemmobacter nanjingensis]|uniref:Insertion element IS402-like domain-containing protein n=1 Tax=Gemmobacter nanjingensis TaxID=488454 RepID=A0ABQ3FNW8_9RHOB|nr:hypothetical protein GCM10007291_36560 [Gemmobacter nanjingensis]
MGILRGLHPGSPASERAQAGGYRLVLDGIFWIARTSAPWRDVPEESGKWSSVCRQLRRRTLAGLWEDVLDGLNHAGLAARKAAAKARNELKLHGF